MFGDFGIADLVAYRCMQIDIACRHELRDNFINSEPAYVEALSTRIRDFFPREMCFAQTIEQTIEIGNGVDGLIIFKFGLEIKIGWYEAKWPRVGEHDYRWDYIPPGKKISHFSEQIMKQHDWGGKLAVWEMFLNEQADGFESGPYSYFGSSCTWHNEAFDFMLHHGIVFDRWKTENLEVLLSNNCCNLYSIIFDLISCRKGERITIVEGQKSIMIDGQESKDKPFEIPLPRSITDQYDDRVNLFMKENNIVSYLLIDGTKLFKE